MEGLWEVLSGFCLHHLCGSPDTLAALFLIPISNMVNNSMKVFNGFMHIVPLFSCPHIFCLHPVVLTAPSCYLHMCILEVQRSSPMGQPEPMRQGGSQWINAPHLPLRWTILRRSHQQTLSPAMLSGDHGEEIFFSCYWKLLPQHKLKSGPGLSPVVFVP